MSFVSTLTCSRRAKIKNIAKKSIEDGGDCNDIPESMRRYLALQAMDQGKSIGANFLGRAGGSMAPYGSGMLLNTDTSSSKVGEFRPPETLLIHKESELTRFSHPSFCMPLFERCLMPPCGRKTEGPCNLVSMGEGLSDILDNY